jgi:hypothetical protein
MINHADPYPQDSQRRHRTKRPKTNKSLRDKIRAGKWSQAELEWLLAHLGEALTPDIAVEIRYKLNALQTRKAVD